MLVYTSKNESLTLSNDAMSSGGEGEIHSVTSKPARFNNVCVKIYFKPKRTVQLEKKIKYMVANPPSQIYSTNYLIGWPLDVVYDEQKNFVGFVMPLAYNNSKPLIVLTAKNLSKNLDPVWGDKYDRRLGATSMLARLKLICNIAIPIHVLHSTEKYVLKDFKPENVLVTNDGKVTLVDMDSIQIAEHYSANVTIRDKNGDDITHSTLNDDKKRVEYCQRMKNDPEFVGLKKTVFSDGKEQWEVKFRKMLFQGTAATPNYIPPEYYTGNVGKNIKIPIEKSWDYFAVGVVFYQVIFGLHPYVVTPTVAKDENSNEIFQNIAQNLFPFGDNAAKVKSYPPPHDNFTHVPVELQQLFKKAFSDNTTARPTLEIWIKTIKSLIQKAPELPAQKLGTISVESTSSVASVELDNRYIGMTPISIRTTVGLHRVVLSCNGISQSYDNVEVKTGETTYIDAFLKKSATISNDTGDNNFTSNHSGCIWVFLIAVICFVVFVFYMTIQQKSNDATPSLDNEEELVDSVEIEPTVEDEYECDTVAVVEDNDDESSVGNSFVEIENIWVDYNVYQDGNKGMRIHVKFNNKNLSGERLTVYAYFYQEDNITQLHDTYGEHLCCYSYCTPSYDDSTFENFEMFMSYASLNMAPGTNATFSFDISIKDSSDDQLARKNNTQFNFSNI